MHSTSAKQKFLSKLLELIESDNLSGLEDFLSKSFKDENFNKGLLNEFCKNEWNALHLSALELNSDLLTVLLDHGADPDVLDGDGNTPTLLVIRRLGICSCQNCTRKVTKCINILGDFRANLGIADKSGNSPLHLAAEFQSLEVATTLLRNGAPLDHRARKRCKFNKDESMLKFLFQKMPSIVIDVFDRAVTVVGSKGIYDPECEVSFDLSVILPSNIMDFYHQNDNLVTEITPTKSSKTETAAHTDPIEAKRKSSVIHKLSAGNLIHPMEEFEILKSKLKDGLSTSSSSLRKSLGNFNSFEWNSETRAKYRPQKEMGNLAELLESGYKGGKIEGAILRHPLVTVFSDVKWRSLEIMFLCYVAMQTCHLIAFTAFIFLTIFVDCPLELYEDVRKGILKVGGENVNSYIGDSLPTAQTLCEIQIASKILSGYVLVASAAVIFKELQHAFLDFKEYCSDLLNYIQLLGLASIVTTIAIAWDSTSNLYFRWFYPIASFGVAISWCQIFIQIGRFPKLAIYVDMLAKILVNFLRSLLIYSFILVGFAMSYCVLFPTKPTLIDIPLAIVKILTMMVGELDYEGLFLNHQTAQINSTGSNPSLFSMNYAFSAHIWYICCVIVVTLVLMNLLVGLAVSDIQGCKNHAEIHVMKRRIRYTAYLEKSLYLMTQFLPPFLKNYARKKIAIIKPPDEHTLYCFQFRKIELNNCSMIVRPNDPQAGILSQESKNAIKYWLRHHKPNEKSKQMCKFGPSKSPVSKTEFSQEDRGSGGSKKSQEGSERSSPDIKRIERRLLDLDQKLETLIESLNSRRHD